MQGLTRRAAGGAAALCVAVLLGSCTGPADEPSRARASDRTLGPASPSASPSGAPARPAARLDGGPALPLVAGQWGDGRRKAPPRRLDWEEPEGNSRGSGAGKPLSVRVTADAAPSYVSFMLHSRIDKSGIPDEDVRRQKVMACGPGITEPGCRITRNEDRSYTIELVGVPPPGHPYRVLYVQWAPNRADAEETWASWQLPTG